MEEHAPDEVNGRRSVGQLIVDARSGEAGAFAALYDGHVHQIRAYAPRLAAYEHAAEDLVSEAFIRTWQQLLAGQGPRTAFSGYVHAAVLNLHLSQLRRDQRLSWVEDIDGAAMANPELAARIIEGSPEHHVLQQLLNTRMKEALTTLPHRWQPAITWLYIEGRPHSELAEHLGLTLVAIRHLARRARVGMRHALAALSDSSFWDVA